MAPPHTVYEWKDIILDRLRAHNLLVRFQTLKVMEEQSPQRKSEYIQYARALELLRAEADIEPHRYETCGRTLRIYAAPTWQELGEPSAHGWEWNTSGFIDAQMAMPSFLATPSAEAQGDNL